ncbi:X-ray repair cross-complementing protein 6 [Dimargaris verticillata]|uniref:X-ray repair cross-complementing protein 6 n=1 Tax=Dimargaris verticillata TaxID=2761393 RepID=A0A9W8E888_9FUNG|nr:X-ray repair cross-complementing protein 6 [Dimargaris verticillata]
MSESEAPASPTDGAYGPRFRGIVICVDLEGFPWAQKASDRGLTQFGAFLYTQVLQLLKAGAPDVYSLVFFTTNSSGITFQIVIPLQRPGKDLLTALRQLSQDAVPARQAFFAKGMPATQANFWAAQLAELQICTWDLCSRQFYVITSQAPDVVSQSFWTPTIPKATPTVTVSVDILPLVDEATPIVRVSPTTIHPVSQYQQLCTELRNQLAYRALHFHFTWRVGADVAMAVVWHYMIRSHRCPHMEVWYDDAGNQYTQTTKRHYMRAGHPGPIPRSQLAEQYTLGGCSLLISPEEQAAMHQLVPQGLQLMGFQPRTCVSATFACKSPAFLYANPNDPKGRQLFEALHRQMTRRDQVAVCAFQNDMRYWPRVVWLLPQPEIMDHGRHVQALGFSVVFILYNEELRPFPLKSTAAATAGNASEHRASVAALCDLIDDMQVSIVDEHGRYSFSQFPDPVLAQRYDQLLARIHHQPEHTTPIDFYDRLRPRSTALDRKARLTEQLRFGAG